ncbi:hypothetical protein MTP10_40095 [Nonomuraea sp. 3-1Str]|uniref:hypothetical protein n=1 Tax=unclassified Nonomuraea TaxID=2593643 RepID=UPI0028645C12|nr:hypothetical protein [Nonomuraea sp. 3-1Str]MDR8414918.1 hypothetical protein [Nonomuraea sp. 3-1Str]
MGIPCCHHPALPAPGSRAAVIVVVVIVSGAVVVLLRAGVGVEGATALLAAITACVAGVARHLHPRTG